MFYTYTIEDFNPPLLHRPHDYDKDLVLIDGLWEIEKIGDVEDVSIITLRRKLDE